MLKLSDYIPPSPERDADRDLFVMGNRGYTNIRTWKLTITLDEVAITPARTAWGCLVSFNILCLLFAIGFIYPIYLYGEEEIKVFGIVAGTLIMLITATGVTALTLRDFRSDQRRGPWLVVDRKLHIVSLPRHGIKVPIEQVDHLQVISGTKYKESRWSGGDYVSELNIVIREEGKCQRYDLLSFLDRHEFDAMAKAIAKLELLPVKRIDSVWDPRKTTQRWLTPEGEIKSGQESNESGQLRRKT